MEKECNVVNLDGIEYTEIHRLENNGNTYVLLSNLDNPTDFCIKKLGVKNGESYIRGLSSEEEFNEVLRLISEEYKD